jgi:hypothetical protein
MPEFYAGQGPVTVYGIHHQRVDLYVFIVPQATVWQRRIIGTWVNGTIAGIDDTPTPLGPRFAHGRTRVWHLVAGSERVGRAVEAIGRCNRPNLDGFKEDIVTGISTHAAYFSIVVLVLRSRIPNVSLCFAGIDHVFRLDQSVCYVKVSVCGSGLCWVNIMMCCVAHFGTGEPG